jgi:VanZ family protein
VDANHPSPLTGPSGRLRLWGPVVLYCGLIFALSSVRSVPPLPGGISDKVAHALLYSGLGFLVARAVSGGVARASSVHVAIAVIGFATVYGLSDETHQLFVPTRQFELKDILADAIGAGMGTAAWWLWGILRRTSDVV